MSGNLPLQPKGDIAHLTRLGRFLLPYRWRVAGALVALVVAASCVLALGQGLRYVIDAGFGTRDPHLLNLALAAVVGFAIFLFRTFAGFQMQVGGLAPAAARYAGFSSRRALWVGITMDFLCFAPQLEFFYRIFGPSAAALWAVPAFWLGMYVMTQHCVRARLGARAAGVEQREQREQRRENADGSTSHRASRAAKQTGDHKSTDIGGRDPHATQLGSDRLLRHRPGGQTQSRALQELDQCHHCYTAERKHEQKIAPNKKRT